MTPAENNTSNHSRYYDKFASMLLGYKYGDTSRYYNPKTPEEIYYCTCFMRDNEISYLNTERKRQYGNRATVLIRLAYIGNGEYRYCTNAREKIEIEKQFDTNIEQNILKLTNSLKSLRL